LEEVDFSVAVRVALIYTTAPICMWEAQYDEDKEMPLIKLQFRPGINRDQTNYSSEGGWVECNKIRFFSGFPQKIGGWVKATYQTYVGVCRAMFNYLPQAVYNLLALGTSKKIYLELGGELHDITPIRDGGQFTTPATNNSIDTTNASNIVTVNLTGHGGSVGDFVTIAGVVGPIGGIPAAEINAEHVVVGVPTANSFEIAVTTVATSTVTAAGGTTITVDFQLPIGFDIATAGFGWGVGGWGGSPAGTGWGSPGSPPIYQPMRLIHFTKYEQTLVYNVRFGDIFIWTFNSGLPANSSVYLKNEPGAADVPEEVTQVLYAQDNGHLLAFGCTPFGGGARDPLLIRWASQSDIVNWTVNDLTTAGFLRVASGSEIYKAIPVFQEILVFTESSISSLQFTGTLDVFSITEISPDVSLISPNAVTNEKNVTYWMGRDKFFLYNGRVETLPCTLRAEVFNNINFLQKDQIFAASNEKFNEIWWFYPSTTSDVIDKYVVYNYFENVWYYGDCTDGMARSAWCESHLRDYPQAASTDFYVYNHEDGCDNDGAPFTAFITSGDLSLDEGDNYMLVRRLIPDVSFAGSCNAANPSVNLTLEPRNFPGANYISVNAENQNLVRAVTRSSTVPIEQYTNQVFVRTRARQIGLTIESSGVLGVAWQLGIPRADVRPDGRKA
jgi:hypothetical protein